MKTDDKLRCPHCEKEFTEKELIEFQREYWLRKEFEKECKKDLRNMKVKYGLIDFVIVMIVIGFLVLSPVSPNTHPFLSFWLNVLTAIILVFLFGIWFVFTEDKQERMFTAYKNRVVT